VYQFHALFLDFLRMRAGDTLPPAELGQLVERSARALESMPDVDAAMALWLGHGRWDEARRLILAQAESHSRSGRRQTLLRWIETIPEALREDDSWLVYWLGRAQLPTGPETGTRTLEHALRLFRAHGDPAGALDCLTTLVGGAFLGFHALEAMDGWLDDFLAEIERSAGFASAEAELRILGVLCTTLFHARPWHPMTEPVYRRVEALLPQCADPEIALGAAMGALVVSGLCGDFEVGDRVAALSISLASRDEASPSEAAWCFGQVAWLRFQEARYDDALECLARGLAIADANGLRVVRLALTLWRFTFEFRAIRWPVASATLAEAEAMPGHRQPMHAAQLALFRARRARQQGHRSDAIALALHSHALAQRVGSRLQEVVIGLSAADVLLDADQPDAARPLLAHVRTVVDRAPIYACFRAAMTLGEARLASVEGDGAATLEQLRQALALAREGSSRYYLRFLDWSMVPLFRLALEEGIEVDLVHDVIRKMRLKPPADAPDRWPWPIRIVTLGRFDVQVNGRSLAFPGKLPRKTLLLLKAIVAFGGHDVPEQTLCDALWGDEDGDAAVNALSITVLRLRKLLGTTEAIVHQGGRTSLNPDLCWVDARAFDKRAISGMPATLETLDLYAGAFLRDDPGEAWSVAPRERLRGRFIDLLSGCSAALESCGDIASAIRCYLRGIEADPVVEAFHQGLMRCYEQLGRRTEAISAYRRMKQTLSVVLGVPPSEASRRLYQRLLVEQAAEGDAPAESAQILTLAPRKAATPRRD